MGTAAVRNKATSCPKPLPKYAISAVGPSNDHELAIARIVDQINLEDRLTLSSIQEVVTKVDFMMNGSDGEFLTSYVQWRMENPVVK